MKKQITQTQAFLLRLIYHKAGAKETIVFTLVLLIVTIVLLAIFAPGAFKKY